MSEFENQAQIALELFGMWLNCNLERVGRGFLSIGDLIGAWDDARENKSGKYFSPGTVAEAKYRVDQKNRRSHERQI